MASRHGGEGGSEGAARSAASAGLGDFFAVDRRAWTRACALGLNPAVAYLVLARGTGADNRSTTWSVQAVETYTGVSRGRAHDALKALRQAGLVQVLREGTRPKYRLAPAHEVPGCEGCPPALDEGERRLLDVLRQGEACLPNRVSEDWGYRNPRTIARDLVRKGVARELAGYRFVADGRALAAPQPDWIWLPNTLVTGAAGEAPPVELVRQAQDALALALRLLVDLYHAQNLREDGGVNRQLIWHKYERVEVGRQAQSTVWGFRHEQEWMTWSGPALCHRREKLTEEERAAGKNPGVDFFRREGLLTRLGLLEWVPHLVEGAGPEAEIIHPFGLRGTAGTEDRLGAAAQEAASSMLTEGQRSWAEAEGFWLVPVPRHIAEVQLVGVARLRYRPRTRMTAAWWADLRAKGERHLDRYRELAGVGAKIEAA